MSERTLPKLYDLDSMRAALNDVEELWGAFSWSSSPEGHDFWSAQVRSGGLTEEGEAALLEMIKLAEAAEKVTA